MAFRFDRFVLDTGARRLLRDGTEVHLSPKAFTLLELLLKRHPNAVSKTEIQDTLWPSTNVVEANIANLVGEIRAALDDDRRQPRCVRTVPRFGYAFAFDGVSDDTAQTEGDAGPASQPLPPSIVVLPFTNASHDAEEEYLSDGLADEVIDALTHVPGIKVIARMSAFAFKGRNENVRTIADALGVTHVLEGTVRRVAGRLRVTVRLVNAIDGTQLWSERYDRELTDVFVVQDVIAAAIASALTATLPAAAHASMHRHEPNLAAYEAYLKGRHHLPKKPVPSPDANARAISYFREAIALDPKWAEPHVPLAHLHFFLAQFGAGTLTGASVSGPISVARSEAQHALALSPSEPTAHAVLGAIAATYDYDRTAANKHFRAALLSASVPPAVDDLYASFYLAPRGQFEAAIDRQSDAILRDPLNIIWRVRRLALLVHAGLYERAIHDAVNVLEFESQSFLARFAMAQAQFFTGACAEAVETADTAHQLAPWHAAAKGFLAGLLNRTGNVVRASALLDTVPTTAPAGRIYYHLVGGDPDALLDWYDQAVQQRHPVAAELASATFLAPVREHPRWAAVAAALKLMP